MWCETYSESPRLIPETFMQAFQRPPRTLPRAGRTLGAREELVGCDPPEGPGSVELRLRGAVHRVLLLGNVALRYPGVRLMWDAPNMKITNMPDADQFVNHNYRAGWSLST